MLTHPTSRPRTSRRSRAAARGSVALATALVGVVAGLVAPAAADAPVGWDDSPAVSGLAVLLIFVLLPVGGALLLAVLTWLPTLRHRGEGGPEAAWREHSEWFGAPTRGLGAADDVDKRALQESAGQTGSASGQW